MLVHDGLEHQAARRPDTTALVCGPRRLSYAELESLANRVAHGLARCGVRRGDRVALYLGNSPEAVAAIFGTLKANATFVVINPQTKRDKLLFTLNHCEPTVLFIEARLARGGLIDVLRREAPSLRHIVLCRATAAGNEFQGTLSWAELTENEGTSPPARLTIDLDLACLIYTSGSTGSPKAVMCDHSNVVFATDAIAQYLEHTSSDTVLSVLPLSFSYGLYQLLVTLAAGGCLVLEESFAFPAFVVQKMAAEKVTGFAGVPTIFSLLLSLELEQFDLSSLRYVTNAAAALPLEHLSRLRQRLPHVRLFCMHGLTEAVRTVFLRPEELDARPGSVGTEVWLEDETGARVGPGEVGEMVVRGRHVMRGYLADPEATAARFRPGPIPGERLCYTGDLFRMDEDGYFYFVGRKDDIIKTRGEKVSPDEVENVLYALEGVEAAAVVGVPDELLGQAVKAFIVLAPGRSYTEAQVVSHCKARLEDFAVPRFVEFRSALPRTATGKILRRELR
jgi:long-chain acyl-CoA synthetase